MRRRGAPAYIAARAPPSRPSLAHAKEISMKRNLGLFAALAVTFIASAPNAHAAPTARQEIAARQYLVGTWNCTHTVGNFTGTYTTTWAAALGDLWLKQTYQFPPRQMSEDGQAVRGEWLMTYDEGRQGWVRFGGMSNGQYFAIRMTDAGEGGWSWKYVTFFPRKSPETPGSDATFSKKSDSEYVVDGPSYPKDGATVTEHHVCKKV
jgi:hypothetical protein